MKKYVFLHNCSLYGISKSIPIITQAFNGFSLNANIFAYFGQIFNACIFFKFSLYAHIFEFFKFFLALTQIFREFQKRIFKNLSQNLVQMRILIMQSVELSYFELADQ
jgi:hypothetical protein